MSSTSPRGTAPPVLRKLLALKISKQIYESTARKAGIDTTKHTHEKFKEGIGKYEVKMTTDAFIENAMTMMNAKLPLIANRNWAVLHSDRPGEQFVISDRPVSLWRSDGRPPNFYGLGYGQLMTDVSIPLSACVILLGRFEEAIKSGEAAREQVATLNGRTIMGAQRFVASNSDDFLVEGPEGILTASDYIALVKDDATAKKKS